MNQPPNPNPSGSAPVNPAHHHGGKIELIARGLWVHSGQVLLCRNLEAGYFYLPGGHVEFGESGAVALAREMMEEAGVLIRVCRCVLVGECSFEQKGRKRHEINLVFHVEHDGPDAKSPPPVPSLESHIAFEWVRLDALHSTDVRPMWLAEWVRANVATVCVGSRQHDPAWVSMMFGPA